MKGNKKMIWLLFIIYIVLSSTGLVLFKMGTVGDNGLLIFGLKITLKMFIGILCYGFSFLLWLYIVSKLNLTLAMPLSVALVNTLVVAESCLLLNEKISITQGIGIIITLTGVVLLVRGNQG